MTERPSLSEFSDAEIATEYHLRALRVLGDPRQCVEVKFSKPFAGLPEHLQPYGGRRT